MTGVRFSLSRLWLIADNTFREAVRRKLCLMLALLAASLLASSAYLREFDFGAAEVKFIADFGVGAIVFFGTILTVAATTQLFFSEIENRTVLTLLAKPVLRTEFIVGKFLGAWLVTLVFCLLLTTLLSAVLWWRERELLAVVAEANAAGETVRCGNVWLAGFVQWIKFGLLAALTLFIASFSTGELFCMVASFLALVICHLHFLAHDAWTRVAFLPARWVAMSVALLLPNFQLFNLGEEIATDQILAAELVLRVAAYGLVYTAVFLGLAAFRFRRREL